MIHQKGKGSPNFEVIRKGLVMNMAENIWPEGKKCAFCLGFDMDSNLIWFNKIKDMENGMQFIKGPSVGEYGPKRGVDRIMNLLEKYGVKATFFIPAVNMERNVPLVERILDNGHEIAHHGLYHEPSYGDTVEEQLEIIDKSQEIFKRIIGKPAAGFRCTGGLCEEAEEVLYNDPNTLYTCQGESSELPVFMEVRAKRPIRSGFPADRRWMIIFRWFIMRIRQFRRDCPVYPLMKMFCRILRMRWMAPCVLEVYYQRHFIRRYQEVPESPEGYWISC